MEHDAEWLILAWTIFLPWFSCNGGVRQGCSTEPAKPLGSFLLAQQSCSICGTPGSCSHACSRQGLWVWNNQSHVTTSVRRAKESTFGAFGNCNLQGPIAFVIFLAVPFMFSCFPWNNLKHNQLAKIWFTEPHLVPGWELQPKSSLWISTRPTCPGS